MKNSKITKDGYEIFAEVIHKDSDFIRFRYYISDKGLPMDIEVPVTDYNNHLSKGDNVILQLLMKPKEKN